MIKLPTKERERLAKAVVLASHFSSSYARDYASDVTSLLDIINRYENHVYRLGEENEKKEKRFQENKQLLDKLKTMPEYTEYTNWLEDSCYNLIYEIRHNAERFNTEWFHGTANGSYILHKALELHDKIVRHRELRKNGYNE